MFCFEFLNQSPPFGDEVIVTTLLSKGWSLGVFFLVRPDTMSISLIRLSSNRNTDSFSWGATRHTCPYVVSSWRGEQSFECHYVITFPSQQNRGHGFFLLMLDVKTTSKFSSMFGGRHRIFLWINHTGSYFSHHASKKTQCLMHRLTFTKQAYLECKQSL